MIYNSMVFSPYFFTCQSKLKNVWLSVGRMSIVIYSTCELMWVKFIGTINSWLKSKCKMPVDDNDVSFITGSGGGSLALLVLGLILLFFSGSETEFLASI